MNTSDIKIRAIEITDNQAIATIVRTSLLDFGAAKPGTAYYDEATDDMYNLYQNPKNGYWVAEQNGIVLGGAGLLSNDDLPLDTVELSRLYLCAAARGKGIGKALLQHCCDMAKQNDFERIYLETMPELSIAVPLYERLGFQYLDKALGCSGHFGCNIWMAKQL